MYGSQLGGNVLPRSVDLARRAVDRYPSVTLGNVLRRFRAGFQMAQVGFVNVLGRAGFGTAFFSHTERQRRRNAQEQHPVRLWNAEQAVFVVIQPVQKSFPFRLGQF